MKKLKALFQLAMIISVGIQLAMSIEGIIFHMLGGDDFCFQWYHPLSVLVCGVLCALPTLIIAEEEKQTRGQFWIRLVLHFIAVYVIVIVSGVLFGWFSQLLGFLVLTAMYVLVYAFAWTVSIWLSKKEENEINAALDGIRDEE